MWHFRIQPTPASGPLERALVAVPIALLHVAPMAIDLRLNKGHDLGTCSCSASVQLPGCMPVGRDVLMFMADSPSKRVKPEDYVRFSRRAYLEKYRFFA